MTSLSDSTLHKLENIANELRQDVIEMLVEAGSGHSAGPLGMADIFTALYFHVMHHDPNNPNDPNRDRLVLSNGHICPILYATLSKAGYFEKWELGTLRKVGSRLQGHPHRTILPGLESTSGPLGSGLSQAVGMALAARLDHKKHRIFCLMSDGEHDAGNTWEALMFAGKHKLHNLTAVLDRNNIQIDGFTEDVMPLEPLRKKYESFNWHVIEIDGHNFFHIIGALAEAKAIFEKPTMIIAHTIPGKGVSFMENDFAWHGKPPNKEQATQALAELRALQEKIVAEHE
ncbi:MAG: transketolase [Patescibacteria group bacterium]|nr:transketolase [Patescibacteria group bacterium]MDE2438546.1 transketolase [Patescibacteria group bacterium]